jgi:hypothetical protein
MRTRTNDASLLTRRGTLGRYILAGVLEGSKLVATVGILMVFCKIQEDY